MRRAPRAGGPRVELAAAYLQRVRETGDPTLYGRADTLLRGVLAREPRNTGALVERAGARALAPRVPTRSRRSPGAPSGSSPRASRRCPPLVDALVELGRHDEAERALQRLLDRKPNLSAYARVSYLRELRGDLRGAASALALAAAAGGPAPENAAAVEVLARRPRARARAPCERAQAPTRWRSASSPATRRRRPGGRGSPRTRATCAARARAGAASSRACRCPSTRSRSARRSSPRGGHVRRARR